MPRSHMARTGSTAPRATGALSAAAELIAEKKPAWRGWIHAGFAPVAAVLGVVAVLVAPSPGQRLACVAYAVTAILLFGTSAVYHRFYWGPRMNAVLRRMDHANIALIIAGTYTPLAVSLLPPHAATTLLTVIWSLGGALVLFRVLWIGAPRWLYTPLYVLMGCLSLLYLPAFFAADAAAAVLLVVGGALYIAGAVCYALKRPRLLPATFSFHEVFHALTIGGFVCHYIAVLLAMHGT